MHLGNLYAALCAWLYARAHGGTFLLRMDDLDKPREVAGAARRICDDLARFGIDWDGEVVFQSQRVAEYERALKTLSERGETYACFCSRATLRALAERSQAEGAGVGVREGEELVYTGVCRGLTEDEVATRVAAARRDGGGGGVVPVTRLRVSCSDDAGRREVAYDDLVAGRVAQDLVRETGDYVLWRRDGIASYHLATAVDEVSMGVTHVIRGDDLLRSTFRQVDLIERLGGVVPTYGHVPVLREATGEKLSKRDGSRSLAQWLEGGATVEALVGRLAVAAGLREQEEPTTPRALLRDLDVADWLARLRVEQIRGARQRGAKW